MALVNIGNDTWLSEYVSCDKLQREIMEQLSLRSKEMKNSDQYTRLSASIRLRLKQFRTELEQLKLKLDLEQSSTAITYEEIERRSRQIELLQSKNIQIQRLFENKTLRNSASVDRNRLMGNDQVVHDLGVSEWGADTDADVNPLLGEQDIESIRIQRQRMAEDQEKGLEELYKIISRQKNIAHSISNEVDLHNEIIDDLGDHINRTDMRVINETQHVQIVNLKDRTCGYWIVIILLFISIIVVAALP